MISAKKNVAPANDDYARLAVYIADAKHEGEKCLVSWCAGCLGDDDYLAGITEAVDVQAMNTRTGNTKTYHLVVSFHPEDEERLTPENFKAIETRFSVALGLSEHQRHCGVHKNTSNVHLHIAYNLIHPETFTMHAPFRDFAKRDVVCRELEREYGLVIDRGRNPDAPERRLGEKAAAVEAHTGQESFETYATRHKEKILAALEQAQNWQAFHERMRAYGLEMKPHGNGLTIKDLHGKHAIKASAVDRSLSLRKLEARFGRYGPPTGLENPSEQSRYQAAPLHRAPERGALYAAYQAGIEDRKNKLVPLKQHEDAELAAIRQQWAAKRREIERMNIGKRNRKNLLALARKHETEAIAKARLTLQPQREAIRREVPFTSWSGFLQHEAESGNEVALAVLRSRQKMEGPEQAPTPEASKAAAKDWSTHGLDSTSKAAIRADSAEKERALLERDDLSGKGKKQLQAFLRMELVTTEAKAEGKDFGKISRRVDGQGVVIFSLESGGSIRDTGKEIFYSAGDSQTRQVASLYAVKKWGKKIAVEKSRIFMMSECQHNQSTHGQELPRRQHGVSR